MIINFQGIRMICGQIDERVPASEVQRSHFHPRMSSRLTTSEDDISKRSVLFSSFYSTSVNVVHMTFFSSLETQLNSSQIHKSANS
jgi:hypothetical protein